MIVTLTANPSNDRTVVLPGRLERGAVLRVGAATVEPGGKGVNVARVAQLAGVESVAILPSPEDDPILSALRRRDLPYRAIPIDEPVRTNITLAEPDGTTTKINEPGPELGADAIAALIDAVVDAARDGGWVVLSGSLPPGADDDLYAAVTRRLAGTDCKVAVDTSGAPLHAVADGTAPPDLIKPNAEELADLVGRGDADSFESDPDLAAAAARPLLDRGIGTILVTLGGAGTVAVREDGTWFAPPLRVEVRSTVGAGDSSLAGWVLADLAGHDVATRLRWANAYGAAAVSLPGTALPARDQTRPEEVAVERRSAPTPTGD